MIGSFAFLIPAAIITVKLLSPRPPAVEGRRTRAPANSRLRRSILPALMLVLPLAAIAYGWLAPDAIDLDGNAVRLEGASGPFQITVFGEPGALPRGPAALAALVQDRISGAVVLDADVDLAVQSPGVAPRVVRATAAQSTNKLLEAATVDLPVSGASDLRVSVRHGSDQGMLATTLDVTPPAAESSLRWGYLIALAIIVGLFVLHRILRSKPLERSASLPHAP